MMSDYINQKRLRNTVANWSTNPNMSSPVNVLFYETNSTDTLDSNLTTAIDMTQY